MPRPPRRVVPGVPLHIVQRGNNRQATFRCSTDYRSYLAALEECSRQYSVDVHAYVLMTNHVHLLVTAYDAPCASRLMQQVGRKYVSYFNKSCGRTGSLWEGRFRSSPICTERYLFACYRYIELNPVRAGLVPTPGDYRWSSYRCNALGEPHGWLRPRPEWVALGCDVSERCRRYRRLFDEVTPENSDQAIRVALRKGRAVG